jgi:hypothetical protein
LLAKVHATGQLTFTLICQIGNRAPTGPVETHRGRRRPQAPFLCLSPTPLHSDARPPPHPRAREKAMRRYMYKQDGDALLTKAG